MNYRSYFQTPRIRAAQRNQLDGLCKAEKINGR